MCRKALLATAKAMPSSPVSASATACSTVERSSFAALMTSSLS